MKSLTKKQKHIIEKNRRTSTSAELASRLHVDEKVVAAYLETLKPPLSQRKERVFKLILVLFPFLLLSAVELLLRLFSYGPNLDIFKTFENDAKYWVINPSVGKRYFYVKQVKPATSYDAMLKVKPENGYRVVVLGASTAAGYPYLHNGAFSRMLRTRLEDVLPGAHVEVVNLAMPAINSFSLRDMADEVVEYEPDIFLIYAGHNEFYGALGIGSTEVLGQFRWFVNLFLELQHLKIVYLTRTVVGWAKAELHPGSDAGVPAKATLMEQMVRRKQIAYGSAEYARAREIFRENLADIFRIALEHRIPVLVSELASNVRDQAPFESVFKDGVDRQAWNRHYQQAKRFLDQEMFTQALSSFRQAAELDDGVAFLHYQMARCLESLGKFDQAKESYYRAKDLDALRFRASEEFNQTIREVADKWQVPVIKMKAIFEARSPHSLIGHNLMVEHLHPNLDGYFLMAKSFYEAMEKNGFLPARLDSTKKRTEAEYRQMLALTPLDHEVATIKTQILMSGWPFKPAHAPNEARTYVATNKVQEVALAIATGKKSWELGHFDLAEHYARNHDLEKAAAEYRALIKGTPYNVSSYLRLGLVYLELKRYPQARNIFLRSLKIEESAVANKWIGSIFVNEGNPDKGIPYLQKALDTMATDPETLYNIAVAFAMKGNYSQAVQHCRTLLTYHPDEPGARELWQKLKGSATLE